VETDPKPQGRRHTNRPVVGQTGARFGGAAGRRRRAAVEPPETDDDAAATDHREDQAIGLTGARSPSALSRWWNADGQRLQQFLQRQEQDSNQHAAKATHAQRPTDQWQAVPRPDITAPESQSDWIGRADWNTLTKTSKSVRPYSWTRGRTTSPVNLEVETLVSATGQPTDPMAPPEHRTILGLCATPRSVAELSALLEVPLGVARVLLGDLAAAGSVAVHRTVGSADAASELALMRRVLAGLQRL
jgi:Protein of unknown function (DUF742)